MSFAVAIDTATDLGTVAVGRPGEVVGQVTIPARSHAAHMMPSIVELLRRASLQWRDVSAIVIADGPGSFTGLRIGLATAKGIIAAQRHLRLFSAPSLLGAAWTARPGPEGTVAAVYDALRGDVFVALYQFTPRGAHVVIEPCLMSAARLPELPVPDAVAGDGVAVHQEDSRRWAGADAALARHAPSAGALLELLAVRGGPRPVDDVAGFEPAYGRHAAAQDRWEAAHGRRLPDS
jgi:tRNA threonylcarbamoyladenosine biosynthesis protein TsaB